jgi:phage replication O-like protein O
MANPQKENGYTALANEIWDKLAAYRLSGEEWQCLIVILRKTYGWQKQEDEISLSQFGQSTGIKKPNVVRSIKKLLSKKIIAIIKNDNDGTTKYRFIKDFDKWSPIIKKDNIVIENDNGSLSKKIIGPLSKKIHTKETLNTKEKYIPSGPAIKLTAAFLETLSTDFIDKFNDHPAWNKCFDKLLKEYSVDKLLSMIVYFRRDNFWAKNFMSPLKLLRKNDDGIRYADYFFERMKSTGYGQQKVDCRTVSTDFSSDEEIMRKQRDGKNEQQ